MMCNGLGIIVFICAILEQMIIIVLVMIIITMMIILVITIYIYIGYLEPCGLVFEAWPMKCSFCNGDF